MAKKDIKNLTIAELAKQEKQLNEKGEFTVEIGGQNYKLTYDKIFRKTKQNKVLEDMVKFFELVVKDNKILELATPYTALLVLKHFTSLEVSDEVESALALLDVLVDLGILGKLIDELPEGQVKDVYELLTKAITDMAQNLEEVRERVEAKKAEAEAKEKVEQE